ncbi:ABC transporter permease [Lichenifustis flavocetrariae]|uniref:ABC transporter permease n=1 Tax=Lichenifustis flavocetrariae TaxID=2949735 RepID=A0AA42CNC0_9HYPH|nr:ABC transporter permease [Lichenifustis flavocetrariae]MCW6509257.1 ABC transporter permease [Lichenifustis flavocetrariae]
MNQAADNVTDMLQRRGIFPYPVAQGFVTVAASTLVLLAACLVFAPSSVSPGALAGSLPFAAVMAIVGLGQLLVVQQGGFDLSVAGGVSLAVVIAAHYPDGDNARVLPAVLLAASCALAAGLANGILVGFVRLNAIIATIGVNALLYGAVFAVSGGVPRITTPLLAEIAGGTTLGVPNSVYFALVALLVVSFVLKKTVIGRRFEAIGANPAAARAVGLHVRLHQMMAYVCSQLLCCLAGVLLAGITREPTAFQGDALLLPSVAVVVLGSTSLLGGRGFPVSTVVAAFFLNQLSQFALAIGVPYSAQTIIQALALGFGIGVYSVHWTRNTRRSVK